MNKESLLCKAKEIGTGNWVVGYYYEDQLCDEEHNNFHIIVNGCIKDIDINTLCKCVGIKDCDNELIFENDIVNQYNVILTVSYCADTNESLGMDCGWYLQMDNFESWSLINTNDLQYTRIIGNIYDDVKIKPTTEQIDDMICNFFEEQINEIAIKHADFSREMIDCYVSNFPECRSSCKDYKNCLKLSKE